MTARIQAYCRKTNQPVPEGIGPLLRCVLESLAMKYRYAITALEDIWGEKLPVLRVVGGGCKDELLLTYTANATNRQVIAYRWNRYWQPLRPAYSANGSRRHLAGKRACFQEL